MITPDLILKSSRKNLSLCVMKDGRVIVRAPNKATDKSIQNFIESKQHWLTEKVSIIVNNRNLFDDVIKYKKFLFLGQKYSIKLSDCKNIIMGEGFEILLPRKYTDAKALKAIKLWYKQQVKIIVKDRTKQISNKIKLTPSEIKFSSSKGRWGACNNKNVIFFNWKIILLPPDVIDYVIVHELCHLVEFNHSKKFWELVNLFLPNYKLMRNKIKQYSFLLDMYN